MPVDILIPVRDNYLLFRQLYESIRLRIPEEDIGQIIVAVDHSPDKRLRLYAKYLADNGMIKLVGNGIPLPSYYSSLPVKFLKSKGHGGSLNRGLEHVNTDIVFILDPDCIILRNDVLKHSVPCFKLDPDIVSVGQVVGGIRGVKVIGAKERGDPEIKTEYYYKKPHQYGMTNASCMLVRMDAWRKYGLAKFWNKGWAHMPFVRSIFEKNYKTCNFDFYVEGYVVHLGGGILKNMRFKHFRIRSFKDGLPAYGMSYERQVYGAKDLGEHYIGYLELKVPSERYDRQLEDKYGILPFDQMAPPVDKELFGPPSS
jgi:glycosyltransferase involved in cell wall biosynthesis